MLSLQQNDIENFVIAAYNAGAPEDQVECFLTRGYVPYPWQWKFHSIARLADADDGPVKIGVGGARGPGKSHGVFAQVALDDCQRVPGLKFLFLRQTGKAASESFEDLLLKVLVGRVKYKYTQGTLKFPNGSRVLLGGFETERDVDKYVGIEYDGIAIEELNQLTKEKVDMLLGSLRTSKPNWRPRLYTSFNPGGLGHEYVKNEFVVPFREGTEQETRFVPANYKDNPRLNKEYVQYLEGLTGALGRAWREGDWDILEGQYFNEWRLDKHTTVPFPIPISWRRFRAYDHGRAKPACCKWYALDGDGRVWCYRELYSAGWNVDKIAEEINRLSVGESYDYSVADPAIFAKQGMVDASGAETIAEAFAHRNITFIPGSNRRVDGWNLLHQYLFHDEANPPKLIHFNTCHNSIRTYPNLIHDEHRPEDLDTQGEDHAQDCDRYLVLSLHERVPRYPTEIEKELAQLRGETGESLNLNDFYAGELYRKGK